MTSIEDQSEAEVDRRLSRLEEKYGSFPVREQRIPNDPDFFARGVELIEDGWIGDAGAWVTDGDGRVLLIRHEDEPQTWGTPGGGHEPGETMEETARREVKEETGVECELERIAWARRKIVHLDTDPARRFHMLTVHFEAQYRAGELSISDEEILDAAWFDEPPARVAGPIQARIERWSEEASW